MANVALNFEIPHLDPTSENLARVKQLLVTALADMVDNNGHLIGTSRDYALAKLVIEGPYGEDEQSLELAKEAEVA